MADPFVAEVRIVGFNFAPKGWAFCDGQILPISQNTALFSLLGTTYGGDGRSTFALPELRAASPMGSGDGPGLTPRELGETGGTSTVTLQGDQMPVHSHLLRAADTASESKPGLGVSLATTEAARVYRSPSSVVTMATPLGAAGGSQPHDNRQPYLGLNFVIALQGVYPPRP